MISGLVVKAIHQPDALCKIVIMLQPRIVATLRQWSEKWRIVALQEAKKVDSYVGHRFAYFSLFFSLSLNVNFENIGK